MTLTRADLESRRLQHMIAQAGLKLSVWSEAELQASIAATLCCGPSNTDIWMFAYGSLIWNPIFYHVDRRSGIVYGWHRRFCLWTPLGRGTPDNPGLLLGLERGGSCRGIVYRIAAKDVADELLLVWRREMVIGSYIPRWVKVFDGKEEIPAIAFTINPHHQHYAGKQSSSVVVRHLETACGPLGSCLDYLNQTVDGLVTEGIRDQYLLSLQAQVQQQ